jgi:large subunit ribosomal protein L15
VKEKKTAVKKTTVKVKANKETQAVKTAKVKESVTAQPAKVSLFNLKSPYGSRKKRKLLGRGSGSGHGKTSTRGSKGQTSRAGRHFYLGFEGGQSPLIRKMPKRGFVSNFRKVYQIVNLGDLERINEATITPLILKKSGLIRDDSAPVKILGNGSIKKAATVQAHAFSKSASEGIVNAGGKAEIINV